MRDPHGTPIWYDLLITEPDRAAAKRALQATMTMRTIDIAALERARAGEQP